MNKTECMLVIFYILIVALLTKPYMFGDNERSRFNTIEAIVEYKTTAWNDLPRTYPTGDKVIVDGRIYSDKSPIFAILCVPFYFVLYKLGITLYTYPLLAVYLMKVIVVGGATAYLVILFYREIQLLLDKRKALFFACALGFCTLLFSYATALNNHTYTALFLFVAFSLYLKYAASEKSSVFFIGIFLGLASATDFITGAFFIIAIGVYFYCIKPISHKKKLLFAVGCFLPLLPYFFFNYVILGNPLLPAYAYPEYFAYEGSWQNQTNLPGFYNHATIKDFFMYAFHSTMGARGLFSHTPLLLIGLCILCYKSVKEKQMQMLPILFAVVGIILYYCVYTVNYGGSSYGSRYLLPLTPILLYFCAYIFIEYPRWRHIFYIAAGISFVIALIGAFNPWVNLGQGIESISFVRNLHQEVLYYTGAHYILHFLGIV